MDYAPDLMAQEPESFIRRNTDGPPFLYFAHTVPHLALQVPDKELELYDGILSESAYDGSNGYLPHIGFQSAYAAMITRMDRHIGRIIEVLQKIGIEEKTLIIFSSDNGPTVCGRGGYSAITKLWRITGRENRMECCTERTQGMNYDALKGWQSFTWFPAWEHRMLLLRPKEGTMFFLRNVLSAASQYR